jgi:integrase
LVENGGPPSKLWRASKTVSALEFVAVGGVGELLGQGRVVVLAVGVYQDTFDLFERLCSPARLKSINERTISRFVAEMRKQPGRRKGTIGMMASTIRVRLQFLHTALEWAAEQKMIPAVPRFPTIKVPQKDPQPVPTESFERLFAKAQGDAQMQAYLLCGWLTGLRRAEALELEWEPAEKSPYVDLASDRIILPAGFVKAGKDQWLPLDPVLCKALEALPRRGAKVFRFLDRKGRPLLPNGVGQRIRRLARQAGVKLTMHTLRKGFGCRYASRVPAQVLQKLMRHSDIKITMGYYANVDDAVMEAVLGRQRNSSRNSPPAALGKADASGDATPCQDSANRLLPGERPPAQNHLI